MIRFHTLAVAGALALAASTARAHAYKLGDLEIDHPWSRATPAAAPVGAGYLSVTNKGTTADRLVSAGSDVSAKVELHEMAVIDGVMRMRALDKGIEIPAGGKLEFKPGGYHIMFIGLKAPLKVGDRVPVTLRFQNAGTIDLEFQVQVPPTGGKAH